MIKDKSTPVIVEEIEVLSNSISESIHEKILTELDKKKTDLVNKNGKLADNQSITGNRIRMEGIQKKISDIKRELTRLPEESSDLGYYHLQPFRDWSIIDFDKCETVMVFGINPSSSELEKSEVERPDNCFLQYIPKEMIKTDKDQELVRKFGDNSYTYPKYFGGLYDLFTPFEFWPPWTNQKYLNCKKPEDVNLEDFELGFLQNQKDGGKYTIMADLIYYKRRDSKLIGKVIKDNKESLIPPMKELFFKQLDFFKPKMILVANALASGFISEFLGIETNKPLKTSFFYKKETGIVFSGMITSGGSLDRYNKERLRRDIIEFL